MSDARDPGRGDPELARRLARPVVADRAIRRLHEMIAEEREQRASGRRAAWVAFAIGMAAVALAWLHFR